jgi:uncharacterized protein (TIGR00251 family)
MYGSMVSDFYDVSGDDVMVRLHVQPGAGRTAVAGRHGDALKVRVGAPPQGGRANDAVVALLSEVLGVAPASVTIVSGASSRSKRIRVTGLAPADVERRLELALTGNAGSGRGVTGRTT